MRKKTLIGLISTIGLISIVIVLSSTVSGESIYFLAGQYLKKSQFETNRNSLGSTKIVAQYHEHNITAADVEYYRNMNIMRDEETAKKYSSDIDVINRIVEDIILYEEAEKLKLKATDSEINEMIDNAILAYSIPEGKNMMDSYLSGAEITFEEYLELLRKKAPVIIAKQKVINEVGKQFCENNGLVYTNINPPKEMLKAQDEYLNNLLKEHLSEITYYLSTE